MAVEARASVRGRDLRSVLRVGGRGWWLVGLLAVLIGAAAGISHTQGATIYSAKAVATAIETPIPVENFEIALTLFATDEVIAPVAEQMGIQGSTDEMLATRTLEADWVTGGAVEITGRSTDSEAAVDLANLAAESFRSTLEDKGLGEFAVLPAKSASAIDRGTPLLDAAAGAILGALLGLGFLIIRFLLRQPIVSEEDALAEFPADKAYGVSVRTSLSESGGDGSGAVAFPVGIENALVRDANLDAGTVCCLLLEKSKQGDPATRHLLDKMNVVRRWTPGSESNSYWLTPESGVPVEALEGARTVFMMVSEGSRRAVLQEVAEEVSALSPHETKWILVFVRRRRRRRATPGASVVPRPSRLSLRGRPSRTPQ